MTNPLLDFSGLPRFDQVQPEHIAPAIDQLLADSEAALKTVTAPEFPAQWNEIAKVLDVSTEKLGRAWGMVGHLNSVADTPALRAAYNAEMPKVTAFWTQLGADEALYAKYKAIDPASLNSEQKQAWDNAMRNFVLGGAELQGEARETYAQLQEKSAIACQKYSENAMDATDQFAYYAELDELAGVPQDVIQAARAAAEAEGKPGYKLTLKIPSYLPVMQFAKSSTLREKLYRAYTTRASEFGDSKLDNTPLMVEILKMREQEAHLLGYPSFGELSVAPKMAQSSAQVMEFLQELASKAKPYGQKDVQDLRDYARTELGLDNPQAWDWGYIGEHLKEARYAFSEQELKQYFPAPKVLAGLFRIVETLFGVQIKGDLAPVWNQDVAFYRIERDGELVGQFYLDPPARNGKRGGAWMDDVRTRWLRPDNGQLQTPIAHLVCNFAAGVDGKPPLLTHDDVITLFHETGHGLHHMLTQVNERDVSGIGGVEWDAVELPSQFMENFCWEWEVLRHMTAHVDTGEPLPRALYDKMIAAKNFQSGMQTLRQIEFSLFDMRIHTELSGDGINADAIYGVMRDVRRQVAVLDQPDFNRMPNTFTHIFAGGYAAGYYSYKWAEVLSADAFASFEEAANKRGSSDVVDPEVGQRYLHAILEAGGSRPAMESFKAFRGREPQLDALLRHQGMAEPLTA
ncbi:M3 family metallopeptidase [Comamonas koreensis]|uniref:oligopeptidase A n=1 Tax=Comamonas koreensis TaxID=160825 RepID=A0AAW4XZ74_9BURK|nr:M3 family metallopeptidase [Comamonas koreensis]MCD2167517.1 M3 family metallopeptidase [Comamonas koreensis]